jgi:sigma-B regulation protein RsbU (phosphoserine phosphatase)
MCMNICKGAKLNKKEYDSFSGEKFLKSLCNIQEPVQVDEYDLPPSLNSLVKNDIKVVAPMKIQDETKGVLVVGSKINKQEFRADELEFLYTLGNQAMISLENARLFEEALEKQRMEEELNIARDIQQGLLPKSCPQPHGFQIHGINVSSRQVGGDYFDCIEFDENHYGICIADVSGKGAPAALLMSNLQASLRALSSTDCNIGEMTSKINNLIYQNTGLDKFITYFYGILNCSQKTFTYVNAGHNPPYLYHRDGSMRTLEKGGLLLGMMPNMLYEMETVELQPGDVILMFTDGISEAMNPEEEEFEEYRIEAILQKEVHSSAREILQKITNAVKEFVAKAPQSDDITMVGVKML